MPARHVLVFLAILASTLAAAGLTAASYLVPTFGFALYSKGTYYLLLLLVTLWSLEFVVFLRGRGFDAFAFVREHYVELIMSACAVFICFISIQPKLRVLSDEANLISVSESMLYDKSVLNMTMAKFYFGNLHGVNFEPEKRPFLFPFLMHLMHLVRGFRFENGFYLNGIVLFGLLSSIAIVLRRFCGLLGAFAAVVLVASYPNISLCATSAGFDLLAAFLLFAVLLCVYVFVQNPGGDSFVLLWTTMLLFTQARYESFIVFPIVLLLLLVFRYLRTDFVLSRCHVYILTPWLILPLILQRKFIINQFEDYVGPPFSIEHLVSNFAEFFTANVDFTFFLPYSTVLNLVAMVLLVVLAVYAIRRRAGFSTANWHAGLICVAILASFFLIYMAYHFGRYTHPASARFFVVVSLIMALTPVVFHCVFPNILSRLHLVVAALVCAVLYHSVSIGASFTNAQVAIRQADAEFAALDEIHDRRVLVIDDRPVDIVAYGYGCVDFTYVRDNKEDLITEIKQHLFKDVLVLQRIRYETGLPAPEHQLPDDFSLTVIEELQFTSDEFLRVAKLRLAEGR